MPTQELYTAYTRFMALMDRAAEAINRKDLGQAGLLDQQVESSTLEMRALLLTAIANSTTPDSIVEMKQLLQQALDRVTKNQTELGGWIAETGVQLGRLHQGALAVHSYGPSVSSRLPSFEQRA